MTKKNFKYGATPTVLRNPIQAKPSVKQTVMNQLIKPSYNQLAAQKVIHAEQAIHNAIISKKSAGEQGITGFGNKKQKKKTKK